MKEIQEVSGQNGSGQTSLNTQQTSEVKTTYLRSRFSFAENIAVEKSYEMSHTGNIIPGDDIKVTLKITNRKASILKEVKYLDTYDQNLFSLSESGYLLQRDGVSGYLSGALQELSNESYQLVFPISSIGSDQSATIVYYMKVLPFSSGKIIVGNLERAEA